MLGTRRRFFLATFAVLVTVVATVAAQSGRSAEPDVLNALLAEVRGLRAAMEQMSSAGPRVQLALGRLQLQEQRVQYDAPPGRGASRGDRQGRERERRCAGTAGDDEKACLAVTKRRLTTIRSRRC